MNRILKPVILLLLSLNLSLYSQAITNVVARQVENDVVVTYDLSKLAADEEVSFGYTTDNGKTWRRITDATGDLGKNLPAGKGKTIRWFVSPEVADQTVKFKVNTIDPTNMVWVEGGTFQMGSNNGDSDEKPVHTVTISGFYIDKYEVTQAEYRRVMGANPSNFKNCDDCPVEEVSWHDAVAYAQKVGKRLPTEAEWEFAARGGNQSRGYKFAGSDNLDAVGWYSSNSGSETHPAGQKKPNELGLYDMSGNVWEWCADWYAKDYYSKSPRNNPNGPSTGTGRVLRGGSRDDGGNVCRTTDRDRSNPDDRSDYDGFRCVQDY